MAFPQHNSVKKALIEIEASSIFSQYPVRLLPMEAILDLALASSSLLAIEWDTHTLLSKLPKSVIIDTKCEELQ